MKYRKISGLEREISVLSLGTWAFGSDAWWGYQDDRDSWSVLERAVELGINLIDTAPVYGRGHSEELVGKFLKETNKREEIVLATKVGLDWDKSRIYHNLKRERMLKEIEDSFKRLQTDYIDLYQIHWPDPDTPIQESAETMYSFYQKGLIKAIGVSNYSVEQMREFMRYSPLHTLQPPYNMFRREIEKDIIPFCVENNISIINYVPLHSGILTGKFFFDNVRVPSDLCRKNNPDLKEPLWNINRDTLRRLKEISVKYGRTLTQLVLNWTFNREGITSVIVGARRVGQIEENAGSTDFEISREDMVMIEELLREREVKISNKGQFL